MSLHRLAGLDSPTGLRCTTSSRRTAGWRSRKAPRADACLSSPLQPGTRLGASWRKTQNLNRSEGAGAEAPDCRARLKFFATARRAGSLVSERLRTAARRLAQGGDRFRPPAPRARTASSRHWGAERARELTLQSSGDESLTTIPMTGRCPRFALVTMTEVCLLDPHRPVTRHRPREGQREAGT